jgi:uncharacterized protein (TIGR02284 family)
MAKESNNLNLDPITREPGAHPVGTGLGAAAGGAVAGAAAGAFGGPVGAAAGAVVGAVAGGLGGKAAAEAVNPTAEEAYWREQYNREPYYETGRTYDDYAPAYSLGWTERENFNTYEEAEPRLAAQWDARRDRSTLTWPQASAATRAAWNRVDTTYSPENRGLNTQPVDAEEVVDTLNDLLESCRDGEYGFRKCAENAGSAQLKEIFNRRTEDCRVAAHELEARVVEFGGTPAEGGTVGGALHRGWVSVRGSFGTNDDQAMLNEAERGEDAALAAYRKALKRNLPSDVRMLVQRQLDGVQRNHDQIKSLRDSFQKIS